MLSVILSSCPPNQAAGLARALVEQRLAACVSVLPGVQSTYRWQGEVQCELEALLLIKTPSERVAACMAGLKALHPFAVPELVELPAGQVWPAYLQWAIEQTQPIK